MNDGPYLDAASRLGEEVAAAAIWSGGRCTWVGGAPEEGPAGRPAMTYASFGPDLYGGTAGVGLVLAELFDAGGGGRAPLRRAALGALEHALTRADEIPAPARLGAHGGALGIALCAARAGRVLGEPELVARAGELVGSLDYATGPLENDLIAGRAGGILALLALRELGVAEATPELATRLGEDLLAAADRGPAGWSWPSLVPDQERNLTGLSHGAAGVGVALLELHRLGAGPQFAKAATAAFAYERSLYNPGARNWPDLRGFALRDRPADATPPARRSGVTAPPASPSPDCAPASWATRRLRGGSARRARDHRGIAPPPTRDGQLLALPWARRQCRDRRRGGGAVRRRAGIVREVAEAGIERYLETGGPWPLGVHEGQTDSLLVGRAGIAYFYLRLHDPRRPSLLLLRPESFASATMPG